MKPLITVVTPCYNNSSTIFETVDSVLSQSYPNIQYIISDDCSDNFDCDEIRRYIASRNRGNIVELEVLQAERNGGIAVNLNRAISYAKGIYLFNLAADDVFYDAEVLSDWTQKFEDSGAQIITACRAVYDKDMSRLLRTAPTDEEKSILSRSNAQELFDVMSGYNMAFGCCTARTKENYELLGGYDERYPSIEDYPANMKALRMGVNILFWDRTVVKYRSGGISSVGGLSRKYLELSERIFKNEILPYSTNKKRAKKKFEAWKNEARLFADKSKYAVKLDKDKNSFRKLLFWIVIAARHPLHYIQRIFKRKK